MELYWDVALLDDAASITVLFTIIDINTVHLLWLESPFIPAKFSFLSAIQDRIFFLSSLSKGSELICGKEGRLLLPACFLPAS